MSNTFANKVRKLKAVANQFDPHSNAQKVQLLSDLSKCALKTTPSLVTYSDLLLFLQAMPHDRKVLMAARKEMARLAQVLRLFGPTGRSEQRVVIE